MARYLLHHRHEPDVCGVVVASFKGHDSPLRHRPALASCRSGGREIWWPVDAGSRGPVTRMSSLLSASALYRTSRIGNRPSNDRRRENGNECNDGTT